MSQLIDRESTLKVITANVPKIKLIQIQLKISTPFFVPRVNGIKNLIEIFTLPSGQFRVRIYQLPNGPCSRITRRVFEYSPQELGVPITIQCHHPY